MYCSRVVTRWSQVDGSGSFRPAILGRLDRGARVAAQAGDALDRLAQQARALAAEADVPVVGLVAHRDGEPDAEPRMKSPLPCRVPASRRR